MYVRWPQVQNLKRLRLFTVDFCHAGQPRMWTVLIGENGTAKTTLLQAIALAATGSKQVNTLAGPIVKHLRDRRGSAPLAIDAKFEFSSQGRDGENHPLLKKIPAHLGLSSHVGLEVGST
ncbi:MAG: AAA family ATPase, partial [Deltaproteobacteria bacterium]